MNSRNGKRRINFDVTAEQYERIKALAAENSMTMSRLIIVSLGLEAKVFGRAGQFELEREDGSTERVTLRPA